MTEKQRLFLSAAAVLFVNSTRDPNEIATTLLGTASRGISARSLERWRAENRTDWCEMLGVLGWDVDRDGDHFSKATGAKTGRKNTDYLRACDTLDAMPAQLTKRQRVKLLKTLMPGFFRTSYTRWVNQWTETKQDADA